MKKISWIYRTCTWFTNTFSTLSITTRSTPSTASLVTWLSKLAVYTEGTNSGAFIASTFTVQIACHFATCTIRTDWTRPHTLPRVSVTSLLATTTGVATEVSIESFITALCTGSSDIVTSFLDTGYTAFQGTTRSVMGGVASFKTWCQVYNAINFYYSISIYFTIYQKFDIKPLSY